MSTDYDRAYQAQQDAERAWVEEGGEEARAQADGWDESRFTLRCKRCGRSAWKWHRFGMIQHVALHEAREIIDRFAARSGR